MGFVMIIAAAYASDSQIVAQELPRGSQMHACLSSCQELNEKKKKQMVTFQLSLALKYKPGNMSI